MMNLIKAFESLITLYDIVFYGNIEKKSFGSNSNIRR